MNDAAQAAHDALPTGMPEAAARAAGLGTDGAPVVMVTATDTTCRPNASRIGAGKTWFEIKNTGSKITELYLEKADTTELIQVERIRSGQSGAFATTVAAGNYLLACEPGMAGHNTQIRSSLTVG